MGGYIWINCEKILAIDVPIDVYGIFIVCLCAFRLTVMYLQIYRYAECFLGEHCEKFYMLNYGLMGGKV